MICSIIDWVIAILVVFGLTVVSWRLLNMLPPDDEQRHWSRDDLMHTVLIILGMVVWWLVANLVDSINFCSILGIK